MNDIEILEEYVKNYTDLVNLPEYDAKIVFKAIENLIKRNKELEGIFKYKNRKRKNGTMKYKKTNKLNKFGVNGVCQDMRAFKRTGETKYRAYITLFGKQYTLGTHNTLEGAIQARKDGEIMVENMLKGIERRIKND